MNMLYPVRRFKSAAKDVQYGHPTGHAVELAGRTRYRDDDISPRPDMNPLDLASAFPPATREAWEAAVARVLKGGDFEKVLVGRTYDGVRVEPIYEARRGGPREPSRGAAPWRIAARLDHPDPVEANRLILADLEGGADALTIVAAGAPSARGFGLASLDLHSLDRALEGVMLDIVELSFEAAPFGSQAALTALAQLAERRGHAPSDLTVEFGFDPIGDLARSGSAPMSWPETARAIADMTTDAVGRGFGGTVLRVDTRAYHEAGASEAQELAAALATGVAYLRACESSAVSLERVRDAIAFLVVADADEFLTIAKIRALRRAWARIEASCSLPPAPARIAAETSWRMTTRRDPWSNLLRGTIAAFSAGIGGADRISILPFTAALGLPDAFARRIARNTQLVLMEEANLWRVADPVGGSGAFEALTEALADEAWTRFQEIEREGGIHESLMAGALQGRIASIAAGRAAAVATRRDAIVGSSEFPDLREVAVAVLRSAPDGPPTAAGALPSIRSAAPYERLRDVSDALLAETGRRPAAFLANLGPIAAFSTRATFARNAFEACGIEALSNDGFPSLGAMIEAFRASRATTACLCSSDAIYAEEAVQAASALRDAGASRIVIAGRPGSREQEFRAAGVTDALYAGCDLPATLGPLLAV